MLSEAFVKITRDPVDKTNYSGVGEMAMNFGVGVCTQVVSEFKQQILKRF